MVAFIGFLPPFDMKPITLAGNLDDYWGHGGIYEDDDYINASISVELGWDRNRDLIRNETVQDVA